MDFFINLGILGVSLILFGKLTLKLNENLQEMIHHPKRRRLFIKGFLKIFHFKKKI